MWSNIFIVLIGIGLYTVYSFLKKREQEEGPGLSTVFDINALEAVIKHHKFSTLTGMKSISDSPENWTKTDRKIWDEKYRTKTGSKAQIRFDYSPIINRYFVSSGTQDSNIGYMARRDRKSNILYSTIVAGDESGSKANLEFIIYERSIKTNEEKFEWVITPCLKYNEGIFKDSKDLKVLFNFPIHRKNIDDKEYEKLGFEIDSFGGDRTLKDDFGESVFAPLFVNYKKNGVEISFRY